MNEPQGVCRDYEGELNALKQQYAELQKKHDTVCKNLKSLNDDFISLQKEHKVLKGRLNVQQSKLDYLNGFEEAVKVVFEKQ